MAFILFSRRQIFRAFNSSSPLLLSFFAISSGGIITTWSRPLEMQNIYTYFSFFKLILSRTEPIKGRYTCSYLDLFCFLCFLAKSLRLSNSPAFMSCVFIWFSRLRWSLSSPRRLSWFRSGSKLILSLVFSSFTPAPTIFPIVPLPWLADIDWKRFW